MLYPLNLRPLAHNKCTTLIRQLLPRVHRIWNRRPRFSLCALLRCPRFRASRSRSSLSLVFKIASTMRVKADRSLAPASVVRRQRSRNSLFAWRSGGPHRISWTSSGVASLPPKKDLIIERMSSQCGHEKTTHCPSPRPFLRRIADSRRPPWSTPFLKNKRSFI